VETRQRHVFVTPFLMRTGRLILVIVAFTAPVGCRRETPLAGQSRMEVTVAAAANLTEVLRGVAPEFENQTGIHPVFSFGSTAQLARQIESSAPFDVFAAADTEHMAALERRGLLLAGSRAVYAIGVLALWIPPPGPGTSGRRGTKGINDLVSPEVHTIAVAKPELAPYGRATVEALRTLGIWERLQPKVVYAENINMARQFGSSGNADAVFTALTLVVKEGGRVIPIDEKLHAPIAQEIGIVRKGAHTQAARRFEDFLLNGPGRDALRRYGYRVPGES